MHDATIPDTVRMRSVIVTTLTRRGKGQADSPVRIITQYWSLEGELLAESDPCVPGTRPVEGRLNA